ncbi:nucleotidyltransferase family protein [Sphingomonas sp. CL5.1]|uniref:nucleotidyltransferase family protein n=1 Tax=Sphingomonas sp. CL5.1 TaxID=2653203 RepID=UPI001583A9C7|nr:nucleotidyltransferase family protein [Sphingomonas sp. CL5.1]QKS01308.1 nucleotidyltransferase family protein [Sphingomonas sp. CL5.1]
MIAVEKTVLVLLAAGKSRRFGDVGSKLDEMFLSRPLGLHVAVTLEDIPFMERIAIVDGLKIDYARHNFTVIHDENPERDMASAVRLGVEAARSHGAEAVIIALADMPRVTATHIYRLLDAADGPEAVVASSNGRHPSPPVLFGAARFGEVLAIRDDNDARDMIRAGVHVVANEQELIDVDTREELEQLRALVHAPEARRR